MIFKREKKSKMREKTYFLGITYPGIPRPEEFSFKSGVSGVVNIV